MSATNKYEIRLNEHSRLPEIRCEFNGYGLESDILRLLLKELKSGRKLICNSDGGGIDMSGKHFTSFTIRFEEKPQ